MRTLVGMTEKGMLVGMTERGVLVGMTERGRHDIMLVITRLDRVIQVDYNAV